MSSINDTVQTALPHGARGYGQYVTPVVRALEAREEGIKRGLREYAQGRGLSGNDVESLFQQVGLVERPAAQASPEDHKSTILRALETLTAAVRRL